MIVQSQNQLTERRRFIGRLLQQTVSKNGPLSAAEMQTLKSLNAELSELETDISIESERDYNRIFRDYLRFGDRTMNEPDAKRLRERRDMTSLGGAYPGSPNGYLVPTDFSTEVYQMLRQTDQLFDERAVTILETPKGGPTSVPNLNDLNSVATLVAQGTQDTQQEPSLGQLSFLTCPTWRSGIVKLSVELDRDSAVPLETLFARTFAVRFQRGIGRANVSTLLAASNLAATTTGAASNDGSANTPSNSVGTDDLYTLAGTVDPAYVSSPKCAWVMNYKTLTSLLSIKDKQGHPIIPVVHNADGDFLLLEKPVRLCPSMPDIGSGQKPIVFGDLSYFVLRTVKDSLRMIRMAERFIDQGMYGFESYLRMDAGVATTVGSDTPFKYLANV